MSDGSFLHVDLTGDGIISDEELETLETQNLEKVVGIVLWLGNPIDDTKTISITDADLSADNANYVAKEICNKQIYDPILKKDCSGCTHGLIAGIKCAKYFSKNSCATWEWTSTSESTTYNDFAGTLVSISDEFQTESTNDYYPSSESQYLYIDGYSTDNCYYSGEIKKTGAARVNAYNNLSRFMGYNNTQVIKGYAETVKTDNHYLLTSCLDSYSKIGENGDNFSEWFIPSMWELYVVLGGDETKPLGDEGVFWNKTTKDGTTTYSATFNASSYDSNDLGLNNQKIGYINSITSTLKGLGLSDPFNLGAYAEIWTSTELYRDKKVYYYCDNKFKTTTTRYSAAGAKQVLAVCAF
jgi:hypothetical protein